MKESFFYFYSCQHFWIIELACVINFDSWKTKNTNRFLFNKPNSKIPSTITPPYSHAPIFGKSSSKESKLPPFWYPIHSSWMISKPLSSGFTPILTENFKNPPTSTSKISSIKSPITPPPINSQPPSKESPTTTITSTATISNFSTQDTYKTPLSSNLEVKAKHWLPFSGT